MDMEKILLIQTAFIGDAVLTLPMLKYLKERYPCSVIDVITTPAAREIFAASPFTDKVTAYDKRGKDKSLIRLFSLAKNIRQQGYSRIYSPHRSFRSSLIVALSGVKETFGFSNASFSTVYKNIVRYNKAHHEVQRNLELAGMGGNDPEWKIRPELVIEQGIVDKISGYMSDFSGRKIAAIAPGSVWATKKFPKDRFIEIINFLIANSFLILLIGGEADASYCSDIASGFRGQVVSTAGRFSIIETVEILKHCTILISNDSAPTHFGMCAGIPVLTIYCSTIPGFGFYPYSAESNFVSYDELSCKPCGIHGRQECPIKTFECAHKLNNSTIFNKISSMIGVSGYPENV